MAKRFLTVTQAVEYLNQIDEEELSDIDKPDLYILPSDKTANLNDEEQIDQDNDSRVEPQAVCGEFDVFLKTEENEASHSSPAEQTPNKKPRYNGAKWRKTERFDKNMQQDQPKKLIEEHPELTNMNAFNIFLSLFPVSLLDEIVKQTSLYALQNGMCED